MSQAKVIDEARADGTIVLEIEDGYSVALVEIPEDMEIDEFFKTTEEFPEDDTDYPAEHAAPHTSPTRFDKFRSGFKKNEGKAYRVIYGRVADTNKWEVATTRYPVEEWTADEAKEFCKSIGGIAFDRSIKKADDKDETLFPIAKNQEYHVKKKDEDKHLVYGIVLEPNVVDLQGDYESEEEIEKAAHRFMLKLWMEKQRPMIGAEHKRPLPTAIPVESYTAKSDQYFPGCPETEEYFVSKGSWILVSLIADREEFEKVKLGTYKGYSIQGSGSRREEE